MFDYLSYDPLMQIITFHSAKKSWSEPCVSLEKWFNSLCLDHGCSLKGRRESFQAICKQRTMIPVIIAPEAKNILIPTGPIKSASTLWLQFSSIQSLQVHKSKAVITFYDGERLETEKGRAIARTFSNLFCYLLKILP